MTTMYLPATGEGLDAMWLDTDGAMELAQVDARTLRRWKKARGLNPRTDTEGRNWYNAAELTRVELEARRSRTRAYRRPA